MRTGVIAKKLGMSRVLTDKGDHVPVTLLKVDKCRVVSVKTDEKHGYTAVQLGYGLAKPKNVTKPMRGHFAKSKVEPASKLTEFRVTPDALLSVGDEISPEHFLVGQLVDVRGTSIGKGFAGSMKRWNFGGMRASHGVSVSHRAHGSTGQNQDPGKVFKNKKMAGHMGSTTVTKQNLKVFATDVENGLLIIEGSVPGSAGGYVFVTDAMKKKRPDGLPMPAALLNKNVEKLVEQIQISEENAQEVTTENTDEN